MKLQENVLYFYLSNNFFLQLTSGLYLCNQIRVNPYFYYNHYILSHNYFMHACSYFLRGSNHIYAYIVAPGITMVRR